MVLARLDEWAGRIKSELRRAFAETHSSREVAGSFALGVFITMLPTLGVGLLVFVLLAWASERISKIALFASVLVFNPVVKWGVYAASFALGVFLLGPVEGATTSDLSLSAADDVVVRLVVGNLILAFVAAIPSYVVCFRLVETYRAKEIDIVEEFEGIVEGESERPDGDTASADGDTASAGGDTASANSDTASADGDTTSTDGDTASANSDTVPTDGGIEPTDGGTEPTDEGTEPTDGGTESADT